MSKKYIIQINKEDTYPFQGEKSLFAQKMIRVNYTGLSTNQFSRIKHNLHLFLHLRSSPFIHLHTVNEIRGKGFIVDYQYIPQPLSNTNKLGEPTFLAEIKCKIYKCFQQMSELGIKYFPKLQDIGITDEGEPKIYVNLNFQVYAAHRRIQLLAQYQQFNQKLSQSLHSLKESTLSHSERAPISEYSQKLDKKLNQIQSRLSMIRAGKVRKRSLSKPDNSSKKTNMVLQYLPSKKTRNNSFTQGLSTVESQSDQSQSQKQKFHRSSFGDYSTTSQKLNQSKQDSLTKRISTALSKTQETFKFYEKYRKRRH